MKPCNSSASQLCSFPTNQWPVNVQLTQQPLRTISPDIVWSQCYGLWCHLSSWSFSGLHCWVATRQFLWVDRAKKKHCLSSSSTSNRPQILYMMLTNPYPNQCPRWPDHLPGPATWHTLLRHFKNQLRITTVDAYSYNDYNLGKLLHLNFQWECFSLIQKYLKDLAIEFHIFSLPQDKEIKVMVCDIPHDTNTFGIIEELVVKGFTLLLSSPSWTA